MNVSWKAAPQSGSTMKPATTYVRNTQLMASRIFSMRRYDPLMVSIQMATADAGTLTYVGMPNSAKPDAMPANSDSVTVALETSRASMATTVGRMPYCSRMSEAKPLPVTQPMRAAVSCTTMSNRHMTGTVHSRPKP